MSKRYTVKVVVIRGTKYDETVAIVVDTKRGEPVQVTEVGREASEAEAEAICCRWNAIVLAKDTTI